MDEKMKKIFELYKNKIPLKGKRCCGLPRRCQFIINNISYCMDGLIQVGLKNPLCFCNPYRINIMFLRYCSKKDLQENKRLIREEREYNKIHYGKYWRQI